MKRNCSSVITKYAIESKDSPVALTIDSMVKIGQSLLIGSLGLYLQDFRKSEDTFAIFRLYERK